MRAVSLTCQGRVLVSELCSLYGQQEALLHFLSNKCHTPPPIQLFPVSWSCCATSEWATEDQSPWKTKWCNLWNKKQNVSFVLNVCYVCESPKGQADAALSCCTPWESPGVCKIAQGLWEGMMEPRPSQRWWRFGGMFPFPWQEYGHSLAQVLML